LFLVPAVLLAGTVTRVLNFDQAELHFSEYQGYDVIELARGFVIPDPGKPAIPELTVTFVVPARSNVTGITVIPVQTVEVPGTFNLCPSQPARPLSAEEKPAFVQPDPEVYASDNLYPANLHRDFTTGTASGFRLVAVNIFPLQYRPGQARLFLHTRLRISISYEANALHCQMLTTQQVETAEAGLRSLVVNPCDLDKFAPLSAETDQAEIEYLVITGDRLAPEFEPFLAYKTGRGLRTDMRTVEWINRNYPGRDLQEKIRNLIIDYYEHRGLSYVLLAGDNPVVPSRKIRVWVGDTRGDIPTDLYYGDLDYSWDSNHNNLFGEMSDSVDLYADVTVGRASVDNATEVLTFISKVRTYEENPATDYIKRALFPSGWLWRAKGYHGKFVNDSIANLTPSGWTDIKMENPSGCLVVADSFDNGFAIFDPSGHGNENGVYDESGTSIYTSGVASRQTNDRRFTIMTSLACTPGNFEAEDCIAEHAHNCPTGGCIGVMMNSRYGWGTPPLMGPSERLCIRFYDYFFNRNEYLLGKCHDRSREAYAGSAQSNSLWRWCMTEFNLLGDPTLDIWSEPPTRLCLDVQDTIRSGSQLLHVRVTESGNPVSGALVCAWKNREVHATGPTNSSGIVNLQIHPVTIGSLSITATGHNRLPDRKIMTVIAGTPEPLITFLHASINDQGQHHPNGILEPGETGQLILAVRNIGTASAANARLTLHPIVTNILIPDSTAELGTIPAGDTAATNSLIVTAMPDILPGSDPGILAHIQSDENEWEFTFALHIGFPGRVTAEIDTTACALTVTARGAIGFDNEDTREGRGFRLQETDTSSLNIASLCLGNSADYVVDRFYTASETELDHDWTLNESLYVMAPAWNSRQFLKGAFTDAGHPHPENILVVQRALGTDEPDNDRFVILVYDIINRGTQPLDGLYAGILADFDVTATDRFHDLAQTSTECRTAYMHNVSIGNRFCGVKLLYPDIASHLACIDHSLYIYPDSGLSDDMKFRWLKGELGLPGSDRVYNWSVGVSAGPFDLHENNSAQRVAFAFVAAQDSNSYLATCRRCQEWFNTNVGIVAPYMSRIRKPSGLTVQPNPFTRSLTIHYHPDSPTSVNIEVYDAAGRLHTRLTSSEPGLEHTLIWSPANLAAGVYFLEVTAKDTDLVQRVILAR